MSFYRTLLAGFAAIVIASPVFADDAAQNANKATDAQAVQTEQTVATNNEATEPTAATDTKVNLNKATAKDLVKVKGINASKARAIVAYRKQHGSFKTVADLANVKGFKRVKADQLKAIEDQVTAE